jgi:hypothetical protein
MRVFQEEIFGPVASLTTFKDEAEAIAIANDTAYGLGAGVFTRDAHQLYQVSRSGARLLLLPASPVWPSGSPSDSSRTRVGQLLPPLPCPRHVWRLQAERLW